MPLISQHFAPKSFLGSTSLKAKTNCDNSVKKICYEDDWISGTSGKSEANAEQF